MGRPKTDCWCNQPDHEAMVGCSICKKFLHYECLGQDSILQLSQLINESPGLYICKSCLIDCQQPSKDILMSSAPTNTLFTYHEPPTTLESSSESVLQEINAKLEAITNQLQDVAVPQPSTITTHTYASVASRRISSQPTRHVSHRTPQLVIPDHSIIVHNIENPRQFTNTTSSQIFHQG